MLTDTHMAVSSRVIIALLILMTIVLGTTILAI